MRTGWQLRHGKPPTALKEIEMLRDKDGTPYRLVRVPIKEPFSWHNIYEHTPVDFFKYGEYPRFIRPIGAHQPKYEICKEQIKE